MTRRWDFNPDDLIVSAMFGNIVFKILDVNARIALARPIHPLQATWEHEGTTWLLTTAYCRKATPEEIGAAISTILNCTTGDAAK